MSVFYSKKEYDEMVKRYEKQIKKLESQKIKLEAKLKESKENYNALLTTATEELTEA